MYVNARLAGGDSVLRKNPHKCYCMFLVETTGSRISTSKEIKKDHQCGEERTVTISVGRRGRGGGKYSYIRVLSR